jgi:hypothetical protein
MTIYRFTSGLEHSGIQMSAWDETVIKNEPMLFGASWAFARGHGGAVTNDFLDALGETGSHWEQGCIDTRVHMLMPGWYPAIPGWHHDDVPRSEVTGQPNYDNLGYHANHAMAVVGSAAPTAFAVGEVDMEKVPDGKIVYQVWHEEVEGLIAKGQLAYQEIKPCLLYEFDWQSFHRATASKASGWRWFGRVTLRVPRFRNEVRRQVQVYVDPLNKGW